MDSACFKYLAEDAALVRKIFADYLRLGSIGELSASLEREGPALARPFYRRKRPIFVKFPVVVSREFRPETGSPVTAPSASESGLWGVISRWGESPTFPQV